MPLKEGILPWKETKTERAKLVGGCRPIQQSNAIQLKPLLHCMLRGLQHDWGAVWDEGSKGYCSRPVPVLYNTQQRC